MPGRNKTPYGIDAGLDDPDQTADRAASVLCDSPLGFLDVGFTAAGELPDDVRDTESTAVGDGLAVTSTQDATVLYVPLAPPPAARRRVLRAAFNPHLIVNHDCRRFLRLLAATVTQSVDRAQSRQAERRITHLELDLSFKLQHSLLTEPARPDHLQVAVRYQPAGKPT